MDQKVTYSQTPGVLKESAAGGKCKYLPLISMLLVLSYFGSALLVNRIMVMGPFIVPGGMLLYPLVYFFGDVTAEVYGFKVSRNLLWFGLGCQLLFSLLMMWMIKIPPASFWHDQAAYDTVFNSVPIYAFTCLIGTIFGGFVNIYIISKWKLLLKGRYFWLRSLTSTTIGEFLFSTIALTPVFIFSDVSLGMALRISLSAYLLKFIFTILSTIPAMILVNILKKKEKMDVYDTEFNPLSLSLD